MAANLDEMEWGRPMTYQFMAQLVRSLSGRIREVRLDGLVAGAYAATVEVEGPQGAELVDARSSDALNLAVLTAAPILAALEVLEDSNGRQEGDSAEAVLMRRALAACPMTITRLEP
jgi:bifunctional DNase/RNase